VRKLSESKNPQKFSKEEINNLILAAQQLEQQASRYSQQMEILNSYYNEIQSSEQTLIEINETRGDHKILMPIGAGNFIYAKIEDTEKVIVTIGAGVHSENSLPNAIEGLRRKKEEVENQLTQIKSSYNEVLERLREIDRVVKTVM